MNVSEARDLERGGYRRPRSIVEHLEQGGLLIHPTETVYGVGGLLHGPATQQLRKLKEREEGGFVVLIPDETWIQDLLSPTATALVDAFWPGPLTMVIDDPQDRFPALVKARDGSVAVRVCGDPLIQRLLDTLGEPMTSTSANRPGDTPATSYDEAVAFAEFAASPEGVDKSTASLDGGTLPGGQPSTLVDVRDDAITVLRQGQVTGEQIARAIGQQPVPEGLI
ncbi:MAG: L-threonylcarbamoyladenylate synthase [Longimicrobiales bacterium]